jgi:hypothetical protein
MTSSGRNELSRHYDAIIHATPPFYDHPPPGGPSGGNESDIAEDVATRRVLSCALLGSCYRKSFALAFGDDDASWTRSIGEEGGYDAAVRWMRDSATKFLLSR